MIRHGEPTIEAFSTVLDRIADNVMITDCRGVIEYVNPAFESTTGYEGEEVLGKTPAILRSGRQDDGYYQSLWNTILSGHVFRATTINKKKDGEIYYADQSITPILSSSNEIQYFVSIWKDVTERIVTEDKLKHLSLTDHLTDVFNYRYLMETLEHEIIRFNRYQRELSFLMMDVDHFKLYNDAYGHTEGDILLQNIARVIKQHIRETDSVCRYGGDEFAVILPETDLTNAKAVAEKIRAMAAQLPLKHPVTVSIGIAACLPHYTRHDLIRKADIALYMAKAQGRDQVFNA